MPASEALDEWLAPFGYARVGPPRADEFFSIYRAHGYKAAWSSEDVEHFLYLGRDIKCRRYFVSQFGFRCGAVEDFAIASLDKYGHPNYALVKASSDRKNGCSLQFDLFLPHSYDRPIWIDDDAVQKHLDLLLGYHLLPVVREITSLSKLFDALKLDLEPHRWFRSNPIVRAAYVVAIAGRLGVSRARIRDAFTPYETPIARQLSHLGSEFTVDNLLDGLVADWRAWRSEGERVSDSV